MSSISSKFNKSELQVLIDAVDFWEETGNHEYYLLNSIKNMPVSLENLENIDQVRIDYLKSLKDFLMAREKEIIANRELRREQAALIKAKLVLAKRDAEINELFDFAFNESDDHTDKQKNTELDDIVDKLKKAESFIKEIGVWSHYQKFLQEQEESNKNQE